MKITDCIFCNIEVDKIILKNELAFAINDKFPHSKGHILIIPYDHFENFFVSTKEEQAAMIDLLNKAKVYIEDKFNPVGYNVTINIGKAAGQIVMHSHIHLIPRYQ